MLRLAMQLGVSDVDAWLHQLTASALVDWLRFHEIEPYGNKVVPFQLAGIRAQMANYLRKKTTAPYKIDDFMMGYTPPPKPQTPEEMFALFEAFNS